MSSKEEPASPHSLATGASAASTGAGAGAGPCQEERAKRPKLATVETVDGGKVAVTRIRMPRIFRLLLALTGVRI